jgi:hypothetical protein
MAFTRRTRVVLLVAVALVVIGALVIGAATVVERGSKKPVKDITTRPSAYQVTYRVVASATGTATTSWEVLTVHRPFASSDLTYQADPRREQGQTPQKATWFSTDELYTLDATDVVRAVAGRQPGPSGSDQALGVELDGLVTRGLASQRQSERVAGRSCRVYRFFEPPGGAVRKLDGDRNHDDLCIDGSGLVLSERWTLDGRLVFRRDAVEVHLGDRPDPMGTAGAQPLPGSRQAATVTKGVDPHAPISAPPAPAGFDAWGPEELTVSDPAGQGVVAQSTVWAFTRGPDVISVEAGRERGGTVPWSNQPTVTEPVHLPGLGDATTALRSDGPEIRIALPGGTWVRIRGTVPLAQLVSYARTLPAPRR